MNVPILHPEHFERSPGRSAGVFTSMFTRSILEERKRLLLISNDIYWLLWMSWTAYLAKGQFPCTSILTSGDMPKQRIEKEVHLLNETPFPPKVKRAYIPEEEYDEPWLRDEILNGSTIAIFSRRLAEPIAEPPAGMAAAIELSSQLSTLARPSITVIGSLPYVLEASYGDMGASFGFRGEGRGDQIPTVAARIAMHSTFGDDRTHCRIPLMAAFEEGDHPESRGVRAVFIAQQGAKSGLGRKLMKAPPPGEFTVRFNYLTFNDAEMQDMQTPVQHILNRTPEQELQNILLAPLEREGGYVWKR